MFPARGREGKFFPDDFTCSECGAPKEKFFDMTDLSDPRTLKALEEDEDFDYEIEEIVVKLKDDGDDAATQGASPPSNSPAPVAASPPPPRTRGTTTGRMPAARNTGAPRGRAILST